MKKKVIMAMYIVIISIANIIPVYAYDYPDEFWDINKKYEAALNSNNNSDIIKYGNQIIELFKTQPSTSETNNVILTRYSAVGKAYADMGDYDSSAKIFKKIYNYALPLGAKYYDSVKTSKARYEQYTTQMDLYTDGGNFVYYGAKNEKKNGVLFGICSTSATREQLSNESMVLIYQELGYPLDSYNKKVMEQAEKNGLAVEFALNCPYEAKTIKNIDNLTSYLKEISEFLKKYSSVPVYLRFGAEFNIWEDLVDADSYKYAFRLVSDYFKSRNSNVAMVWSPNQTSNWYIDIDDFYPGDKYVDWVGMSSYASRYFKGEKNQKDSNEIVFKSGRNSNPVIMVKDIIDRYGGRKPIMISESGCGHTIIKSGEDASEFAMKRLKQYYSYLPMVYPQIKLIAYFDHYVISPNEKNDYRLTTNANLQKEYIKLTKGERFIQDGYDNDVSMSYQKVGDGTSLNNTFLVSCYAHKYDNDTQKVTYFIDDKYAGMSSEIPYSTHISAEGYSGSHKLKAVAKFADGSTETREYNVNIAGKSDITVKISDKIVSFDQNPVIYRDRTMVPMRKIFEMLNADVSWDSSSKTATGIKGDRTVKISVGSTKMYVNNKAITLDVAPIVIAARTLVPVRAIAEGLGCDVDWDGISRLVSITPKNPKWSEWTTELPDSVNDDLYYIEEKQQSRERTREESYFKLPAHYFGSRLPGNYVRTETAYGDWSDWYFDYIPPAFDREIETRTQQDSEGAIHTEYRYRQVNKEYVLSELSDWSEWSEWRDNAYYVDLDYKIEVEERFLYRYKEK